MKLLTLIMTALALSVIVLGAYTRLNDAGLGCPDWPGCYGKITVPSDAQTIADAENQFLQPVEPAKAWIEMIHRYAAGLLGLCIFVFSFIKLRQWFHTKKGLLLPVTLIALLVTQALLGMWTVTLKLQPWIVSLHLIGGMSILAILWWQHLKTKVVINTYETSPSWIATYAFVLTIAVIMQILLGGLTSSHYAALICPDFPYCQGQLLPALDFRGLLHWDNGQLPQQQLITIHMLHRLGAIVVATASLILGILLISRKTWSKLGFTLLLLISLQVCLGILNIIWLLPIKIAVLHNAVAMLLLLTVLTCYFYLSRTYQCKLPR